MMRSVGRVLAAAVAAMVLVVTWTATGYGATAGGGTARVVAEATSVPAGVLNAVGAGAIPRSSVGSAAAGLGPVNGRLLTRNGKPELIYIGADYCPFCAVEQWAMVVALSRFGRFAGLSEAESTADDVYPHTVTLRFYRASYTSRYLRFTAVDWYSASRSLLQQPTAAELALMNRYDDAMDAVPFIDVANRYVQVGAIFSPQVLGRRTWWQVAVALHDPSSAIARSVDGAANYLTAAICAITGNNPATACTPVIRALQHSLELGVRGGGT